MKTILKLTLLLSLITCTSPDNIFEDLSYKGGYLQFEEVPQSKFDFNDIENLKITATVLDRNNNAQTYALTLYFRDLEINNFIKLTEFPGSFTITAQSLSDAIGIPISEFQDDDVFKFIATVVSETGTYVGKRPTFNPDTGTLIGNTTPRLFRSGQKDAMAFEISFFTP